MWQLFCADVVVDKGVVVVWVQALLHDRGLPFGGLVSQGEQIAADKKRVPVIRACAF